MPTLEKYLGKVYLWHYVPSLPAALVFTGLFALATIAHIWKMARTRMWFCLPFVIGGICTSLIDPNHPISATDTVSSRSGSNWLCNPSDCLQCHRGTHSLPPPGHFPALTPSPVCHVAIHGVFPHRSSRSRRETLAHYSTLDNLDICCWRLDMSQRSGMWWRAVGQQNAEHGRYWQLHHRGRTGTPGSNIRRLHVDLHYLEYAVSKTCRRDKC